MWMVEIDEEFEPEFLALSHMVQDEAYAVIRLLQQFGPQLRRPHADTLANSKYANMKELRFEADDGVWRIAFAFDTERKAILLVAGDKSGVGQKTFYRELIRKADRRFEAHLRRITQGGKHHGTKHK